MHLDHLDIQLFLLSVAFALLLGLLATGHVALSIIAFSICALIVLVAQLLHHGH